MTGQNRRKTRTTLQDISKAAGVSIMTVSNVVHGRDGAVSEKTKRRVEKVVKRLGYRPNANARSLRLSSSNAIGMIISDSDPAFLSDPFISQLVSGISNFLSAVDYSLDIQGVTPENFEDANILRKSGSDALCAILCGPSESRRQNIEHLKDLQQPVVIFQEDLKFRGLDVATIRQDDEGGGMAIGQHLIAKKAKRVAFVKPSLVWPAIECREHGLRTALKKNGSRVSLEIIQAESEAYTDVKKAVAEYLDRASPDSIVAATDHMGIAAMHACNEKRLSIPGDVRISGFNGFDAWQFVTPTLTTVKSPAYEMGQKAGEVLIKRLNTDSFAKKSFLFPTKLLIGQST